MSLPGLSDLVGLEGARVLVRLDLNVPLAGNAVQDDTRIVAALPTIRFLLQTGARLALCSHLGKANGSPDAAFSLRPVAAALTEALGQEIPFVEDCLASDRMALLEDHQVVLLENLRFYPGEKKNDPAFADTLTRGFSHYVNDAFGTAHRAHASVSAAPVLFDHGHKAAGLLMGREVEALSRVVGDPAQPFVAVVGGAKISTKTAPLEALMGTARRLLIGGGMANTFFLAKGLEVGRSLVEGDMLETARTVMDRAEKLGVELLLPTDVVITNAIDGKDRIEVVSAEAVPPDMLIVDLGPESRNRYTRALSDAKTVFWNGPMGVFEVESFAAGTLAVAHAMASCPGFTVIGGGESVMAAKKANVEDQVSHISTGGGASLQYITGEPLPALTALEE
jgi:phosphoglycerate kinase